MKPTKEFLLSIFDYNPLWGSFIWKNPPNRHSYLLGQSAGRLNKGYLQTRIHGRMINLHHLVWFIEKNEWPNIIDHINGITTWNQILNLRSVTNRRNSLNRIEHRNGKLAGCSFEKFTGRWRSSIQINGKTIHMGRFNSEIEAHERYLQALKDYNV